MCLAFAGIFAVHYLASKTLQGIEEQENTEMPEDMQFEDLQYYSNFGNMFVQANDPG